MTLCSADSPLSDGRTVKEGVTSLLRLTREGEERIEESFAVSFPRYCQNHYKFRKEMGIPESETALNGSFFNNIHVTEACTDLVLFIEGSGFAFERVSNIRLTGLKINTTLG